MYIASPFRQSPKLAEVILPLGLTSTLTYGIPTEYLTRAAIGMRVVIPFRKKIAIGIIAAIHEKNTVYPIKSILEIPDSTCFYSPIQYKLIEWVHSYYLAPLGSVLRTAFESQKNYFTPQLKIIGQVDWAQLGFSSTGKAEISWQLILEQLGYQEGIGLLSQLLQKKSISLAPSYVSADNLALPDSNRLKQGESSEWGKLAFPLAQKLAAIIAYVKQGKNIYLRGGNNAQQQQIYQAIVDHIIQQGGQVLYLCPGKKQAQTIFNQFKKQWQQQVKGYYNGIVANTKQKIAAGVANQSIACVVGRPGALFLPFANLQLIIISQAEHIGYKKVGVPPRYHGRDTALMLAQYKGIATLQGDIVPSLDSYYNIKKNKYCEVELPNNPSHAGLQLVGVTAKQQRHKTKGIITAPILKVISKALEADRPIVVIHSRRGYAYYHQCCECSWIPRCSQCNVSLTYHQTTQDLQCHYCLKREKIFHRCPVCDAAPLKQHGMGIQQVEEFLRTQYPASNLVRLDADSLSPSQYHKVVVAWQAQKINLLLSTSRVIQELPITQNGLAVFLELDERLKQVNFHSQEQIFYELATTKAKGYELLLQTNSHELRKIAYHATEKNSCSFYDELLADRQIMKYPPFSKLLCMMFPFPDSKRIYKLAKQLVESLSKQLDYPVLGPWMVPSIVGEKYGSVALWALLPIPHLMKSRKKLYVLVNQWITEKKLKSVKIIWDVDP